MKKNAHDILFIGNNNSNNNSNNNNDDNNVDVC